MISAIIVFVMNGAYAVNLKDKNLLHQFLYGVAAIYSLLIPVFLEKLKFHLPIVITIQYAFMTLSFVLMST